MSIVTAVTNPELPDFEGVSIAVPKDYVKGIDTDGDGVEDVTDGEAIGNLIIDYDKEIESTNGQLYKANTAPVIINTGAAGYGTQKNQKASSTYADDGYINVACGNRGKTSSYTDDNGDTIYTGDAPSCLVDQKNVVRFLKYNILLKNIPGSIDYFVSTGGSGGGAHALMLAATSNNSDFYDYEIELGAVGVYKDSDGNYITSVTIDDKEVEISDGVWGSMPYSAITPLYEGDIAMAFEYYLNSDYTFSTPFQKKMAEYLSTEYMNYINDKNISISESKLGIDVNNNGSINDNINIKINYDKENYSETNGYYGTYLDLYLAQFEKSLEAYLDRLDYATDFTWFDENGKKLSDEQVSNMSLDDKKTYFIKGLYAKSSSRMGGMGGGPDMGAGSPPDMGAGNPLDKGAGNPPNMKGFTNSDGEMIVGTPDSGTTQSASSKIDSSNYESFDDMINEYKSDIDEIEALDKYGKNIVNLYNPINYIGKEGTENPVWSRILMGAAEGDMSMLNSLNIQMCYLNAGVDSEIEWQWDGGHVPSEIFDDSLALYVDMMYGKYVDGAKTITKKPATKQTSNGSATEKNGTDLSSWISYDNENGVSFTLKDAATYRTKGASKAIPSFDVIDYGQEDYVFGSATKDARHWDKFVLNIFSSHKEELKELFNKK